MTTTSGMVTLPEGSVNPIEKLLSVRGFKKVTNGCWESREGTMRVYAFGVNPLNEWKIFQLEGRGFKQMAHGTGAGSDDLQKFLSENTL